MLAVVWKHCCDDAAELANESCFYEMGENSGIKNFSAKLVDGNR